MKHYTDTIPVNLAEKLKEKGMPLERWDGINQEPLIIRIMEESAFDWLDEELGNEPSKEEVLYCVPTYAEVFDWLMSEKEIEISFEHHFRATTIAGTMETSYEYYHANISMLNGGLICYEMGNTWHEAANAAIEKALELI